MPAATKASKAAYSPVLRRDRKDDTEAGGARNRQGQNPFEPSTCWGKSVVFWLLSATLIIVIVAVVLTISFVLTSYYAVEGPEDRYLDYDCLDELAVQGYNDLTFADGCNDFGRRLFDRLTASPPSNLVVSPYSVYSVLAMLLSGAEDQTELKMKSVLELPCSNDTVWMDAFRRIARRLNSKTQKNEMVGTEFIMESANQAYVDVDYDITSEFIHLSLEYFGGRPQRLEFDKPEEATRRINNWVEQQTRGKIRDLIASGSLSPESRLVLVNAVYFRAGWLHPFDPNRTDFRNFTLPGNGNVEVEMMELEADLQSVDVPHLNAEILKLPYFGERAHMLLILPNENADLTQVESALLDEESKFEKALQFHERARTLLRLPKFRIESTHDLKPVLTALGLGNIFSVDADFSGIVGRKDLVVDQVLQKAFVEVNEKGTEAAAATATISKSAIMEMKVEKEFVCDRPFIFIIRDEETGLNLFEGKLVHPHQSEIGLFN